MIDLKKECFGCGACVDICPANCLIIKQNAEGFYIPDLKNPNKCISCAKCEKVCPLEKDDSSMSRIQEAYLFINDNEYIRGVSSSGGFFSCLSKIILNKQGVVCGAAFDSNFTLRHRIIENEVDLFSIMGSKYVQSDLNNVYFKIKEILKKDRWVLFSGTPCQVAGIYKYLKDEHTSSEKLLTVDLVCHGVPSDMVWKKYLSDYHGNEEIRYVQFRYKFNGWWKFNLRIQYAHHEYLTDNRIDDPYYKVFSDGISLNENCYDCIYRNQNHCSDFLIGDAWNINRIKINMDDNKGITSVFINTEKAKKFMGEILKENKNCYRISIDDSLRYRSDIMTNKSKPKEREQFFEDLKIGFKYAYEKLEK